MKNIGKSGKGDSDAKSTLVTYKSDTQFDATKVDFNVINGVFFILSLKNLNMYHPSFSCLMFYCIRQWLSRDVKLCIELQLNLLRTDWSVKDVTL